MFAKESSVVPSLDRNIVHSLIVPFHKDITYQKRIASVLSNINRKIELNRAINQNLLTLDRSSTEAGVRHAA